MGKPPLMTNDDWSDTPSDGSDEYCLYEPLGSLPEFYDFVSVDPKRLVETLRTMHIKDDMARVSLMHALNTFMQDNIIVKPSPSSFEQLRGLFQSDLLGLLIDLLTDDLDNKWSNRAVRRIIYHVYAAKTQHEIFLGQDSPARLLRITCNMPLTSNSLRDETQCRRGPLSGL